MVVFSIPWILRTAKDTFEGKADFNRAGVLEHITLWLNSIAENSDRAPVLLVGSRKDQIPGITREDLKLSNAELAISNTSIKEANKILGEHIRSMPVYTSKRLNLHFPEQPEGSLYALAAVLAPAIHCTMTPLRRIGNRGLSSCLVFRRGQQVPRL